MEEMVEINPVKKEEIHIFYQVCQKEEPIYSYNESDNQEEVTGTEDETEFIVYKSDNIKLEPEDCKYFISSKDLTNLTTLDEVELKSSSMIENDKCMDLTDLLNEQGDYCDMKYQCAYCNFSSKYRHNLKRHFQRKHLSCSQIYNEKIRLNKCKQCNFKYSSNYELKLHNIYKHNGVCSFNCYFCKFGCIKKIQLLEHIIKKHACNSFSDSFKREQICIYCDFVTDIKSVLLTHILKKHRKKIITFPCKLCSHESRSKSDLLIHIDGFHKKIRPYACVICDYSANKMTDLNIHIAAKHNKITPFKCEKCNYASGYKKHLKRHILSQHVNKKARKNGKSRNLKS